MAAVLAQAAAANLLLLAFDFDLLVEASSFLACLTYLLEFTAFLRLRYRDRAVLNAMPQQGDHLALPMVGRHLQEVARGGVKAIVPDLACGLRLALQERAHALGGALVVDSDDSDSGSETESEAESDAED